MVPDSQPVAAPIAHLQRGALVRPARSIRKGKWTNEEEAYTARIIHHFNLGVLQLPEGTTLRAYLAQKLECDPMRITKKFTGSNCLGKRVYHSCERTLATFEEIKSANTELAELEANFRTQLEQSKERKARLLNTGHMVASPIIDAMVRQGGVGMPSATAAGQGYSPRGPTNWQHVMQQHSYCVNGMNLPHTGSHGLVHLPAQPAFHAHGQQHHTPLQHYPIPPHMGTVSGTFKSSGGAHGVYNSQSPFDSEKGHTLGMGQGLQPPSPVVGIGPQSYLQTPSGQFHNPYWGPPRQHIPRGIPSGSYMQYQEQVQQQMRGYHQSPMQTRLPQHKGPVQQGVWAHGIHPDPSHTVQPGTHHVAHQQQQQQQQQPLHMPQHILSGTPFAPSMGQHVLQPGGFNPSMGMPCGGWDQGGGPDPGGNREDILCQQLSQSLGVPNAAGMPRSVGGVIGGSSVGIVLPPSLSAQATASTLLTSSLITPMIGTTSGMLTKSEEAGSGTTTVVVGSGSEEKVISVCAPSEKELKRRSKAEAAAVRASSKRGRQCGKDSSSGEDTQSNGSTKDSMGGGTTAESMSSVGSLCDGSTQDSSGSDGGHNDHNQRKRRSSKSKAGFSKQSGEGEGGEGLSNSSSLSSSSRSISESSSECSSDDGQPQEGHTAADNTEGMNSRSSRDHGKSSSHGDVTVDDEIPPDSSAESVQPPYNSSAPPIPSRLDSISSSIKGGAPTAEHGADVGVAGEASANADGAILMSFIRTVSKQHQNTNNNGGQNTPHPHPFARLRHKHRGGDTQVGGGGAGVGIGAGSCISGTLGNDGGCSSSSKSLHSKGRSSMLQGGVSPDCSRSQARRSSSSSAPYHWQATRSSGIDESSIGTSTTSVEYKKRKRPSDFNSETKEGRHRLSPKSSSSCGSSVGGLGSNSEGGGYENDGEGSSPKDGSSDGYGSSLGQTWEAEGVGEEEEEGVDGNGERDGDGDAESIESTSTSASSSLVQGAEVRNRITTARKAAGEEGRDVVEPAGYGMDAGDGEGSTTVEAESSWR